MPKGIWNRTDKHRQIYVESRIRNLHKPDCVCCICKAKRKEPHSIDCRCISCKTKKGIIKGENAGFYGKKHTIESKEKNRQAHLGKKQSEKTKLKRSLSGLGKLKPGTSAALNGKTYEQIHGIAKAKEMKAKRSGEHNCNWCGGLSRFPYPIGFSNEVKKGIRERDLVCQLCGKTKDENGECLSIHHIDYNKENLELNNLITLCRCCNSKVNKNREYWTKYFLMKWLLVA